MHSACTCVVGEGEGNRGQMKRAMFRLLFVRTDCICSMCNRAQGGVREFRKRAPSLARMSVTEKLEVLEFAFKSEAGQPHPTPLLPKQ